jgi:hypothetical protein
MLGVEILPGKQELPKVPDFDFLDVELGPRPDWQRAAVLGAVLGVSVLAVGALVVLSRKSGRARRS